MFSFLISLLLPLLRFVLRISGSGRIISVQKASIQSLPPELLYEIFEHLDWKSLLTVQLVCQAWRHTGNAFLLSIKGLVLNDMVQPEEPLADHTTPEIVARVIRRLRVLEFWESENNDPCIRVRQTKCTSGWSQMRLVPGGRWLLVSETGCIFCYDLDSPTMTRRLLIDTGNPEPIEMMKQFVYWIDPSKPKLSFRVAMWCRYHLHDIPFIRTYVYQVDLVGHGRDASLEARKIVVLRDYRDRTKGSTAVLTDKYLIEFWFERNRDNGFLLSHYNTEVDEGVQSNRIRVQFAQRTIVLGSCIDSHDQIIFNTEKAIEIYTIQQVEAHDMQLGISPLRRYPLPCRGHSTTPYSYQGFTWFAFETDESDDIRLLRISAINDTEPITNIKIGDLVIPDDDEDFTFSKLDYTAGAVMHEDGTLDIVKYSWSSDMRCNTFLLKQISLAGKLTENDGHYCKGIDGNNGRIVFVPATGKDSDTILVVDILAK